MAPTNPPPDWFTHPTPLAGGLIVVKMRRTVVVTSVCRVTKFSEDARPPPSVQLIFICGELKNFPPKFKKKKTKISSTPQEKSCHQQKFKSRRLISTSGVCDFPPPKKKAPSFEKICLFSHREKISDNEYPSSRRSRFARRQDVIVFPFGRWTTADCADYGLFVAGETLPVWLTVIAGGRYATSGR